MIRITVQTVFPNGQSHLLSFLGVVKRWKGNKGRALKGNKDTKVIKEIKEIKEIKDCAKTHGVAKDSGKAAVAACCLSAFWRSLNSLIPLKSLNPLIVFQRQPLIKNYIVKN